MRRDGVTAQDVETQSLDRSHLGLGEIGIVEIMTGIVDLDADRAGIDVGLPGPSALPGMPGALGFGNELRDPPFFVHEVMA